MEPTYDCSERAHSPHADLSTIPDKVKLMNAKGPDQNNNLSQDPEVLAEGAEQQPEEASAEQKEGFPIVGIGASAGGLSAFEQFFQAMPETSGIAFVLVQHLAPDHESELAELLQNYTRMTVTQVEDKFQVQPDHVYVIPPGKSLSIEGGVLHLSAPQLARGRRAPIDLFLRSLAEDQGENAVCIILSGTGTDGTLGLKAVRERAGLTMVQSPEEAEYDGMPQSAIRTGLVDVIGTAGELAQKLVEYKQSAAKIQLPHEVEALPEDDTEALNQIFAQLQAKTGHDFTHYKRSTILRRIGRRLQVNRIESIPAYLGYLRQSPEEVQALFKDFLISVTNFFRDPEPFEALEKEVIPQLFQNKRKHDQVRVWVAGCATGEEAYSVAMLLCEYAAGLDETPQIQVFATDIDEQAIAFARTGLYPNSIAADISPERLKRFFTDEAGGYRVKKEIREIVLFAVHNLIKEPPFSRLDLITCRNLLIYLDREMQAKVLELFHYALNPGGYLFLGTSESADVAADFFSMLDKKHHFFKHRDVVSMPPFLHTMSAASSDKVHTNLAELQAEKKTLSLEEMYQAWTLRRYAPPRLIIDENYNISHIFSGASRYLREREGPVTHNILQKVLDGLRLDLRAALYQAFQKGERTKSRLLRLEIDGQPRLVRLHVGPIEEPDFPLGYVEIVFEEREEVALTSPGVEVAAKEAENALVAHLEEELLRTRERLQTIIEEYETSNEELKASNEELQSMNEELRSTSEELETGQEELQSMNEELVTLNQELKNKIEELNQANNDLQNLIESTDIGTIFLDRDLTVKRFTPRVTDLFNLIGSDIGRPFAHISHNIEHDRLVDQAKQVLSTLETIEELVQSQADRWYMMRLFPYRTLDDRINGVVITFVEVTDLKRTEDRLLQRTQQQAAVAELGQRALLEQDLQAVMDDVAATVAETLEVELCKVLELLPGDQKLLLRAGVGWRPGLVGQVILSTGLNSHAGYTLRRVEPVIITDLRTESRFNAPLLHDHGAISGINCLIADQPGQPYGVLGAHTTRRRTFTRDDVIFLQAMANLISNAIQRKRAEEALRTFTETLEQRIAERTAQLYQANEALAQRVEELDQFSYVASHDLKAPLRAIDQLATWIAEDTGDILPEKSKTHLEKLQSRVRRMEQLLEDLLAYSRADRQFGQAVMVDTGALVNSIVELLSPLESFVVTVQEDMPVITTAHTPLETVFMNLIDNAIKHHHRSQGRVYISARERDQFVEFSVADDGPGIAEAFHERIFQMFQTLRPRDEVEGSGVGLAVVKKIVTSLGGTIWVESREGEGATFRFTWPKNPPQPDGTDS